MSLRKPWVLWGLLGTGLLAGDFWVLAALWSKPDGSRLIGGRNGQLKRIIPLTPNP